MVELIWDSKYDARSKGTAPVLETLPLDRKPECPTRLTNLRLDQI